MQVVKSGISTYLAIMFDTHIQSGSSYIVHRRYNCGHPDEFLEIKRFKEHVKHTIISPPRVRHAEVKRAYQQTLERCCVCVEQHMTLMKRDYPRRSPRSLATHTNEVRSSLHSQKDGFSQVLARHRFLALDTRTTQPVRWKDEEPSDPEHCIYTMLKTLYSNSEASRKSRVHKKLSFEKRIGRRTIRGPEGRCFTIETGVSADLDPDLAYETFSPDSSPTSPDSAQRRSGDEAQDWILATPSSGYPQPAVFPPNSVGNVNTLSRQRLSEKNMSIPQQHYSDGMISNCQQSSFKQPPEAPPNDPSYVPPHMSHQRPFGPTRPSGGTTLSFGDEPKTYINTPQSPLSNRGRGQTASRSCSVKRSIKAKLRPLHTTENTSSFRNWAAISSPSQPPQSPVSPAVSVRVSQNSSGSLDSGQSSISSRYEKAQLELRWPRQPSLRGNSNENNWI